nr:hypothetical protein [Tanacetum cinerariifolium]
MILKSEVSRFWKLKQQGLQPNKSLEKRTPAQLMQAVVAANHAQAIIIPRLEEYENIFGGTCYKIYTRTHTRVEVKVKSLAMTMTMRTTRMTMVNLSPSLLNAASDTVVPLSWKQLLIIMM